VVRHGRAAAGIDAHLDPETVDIEEFASCPKGSVAATFDPLSMTETARWSRPAGEDFSNATMALEVGNDVWIGSFSGDRIGILVPRD
jgi:hypothetical protein|tara:strand:- start:1700 stop:1960 length:261 start_codon:yes stop_codon:yes gene_type:complete